MDVVIDDRSETLQPEAGGYFSAESDAVAGDRYGFRLNGDVWRADPCSRSQPDGPEGASQLVDPTVFEWRDQAWRGRPLAGSVVYELHVGTFTPEGTWRAAAAKLAHLADLGITTIEVMPIHAFPGRFNWGYDGVCLFAPYAGYGTPDDFRHFVDAAHAHGLAVILDVVYNHFGPSGCYLRDFSPYYFTDKYPAEWGEPVRFEGAEGEPVRAMVCENAAYWVHDFHLDGLRLDATQNLFDQGARHIIADIAAAARAAAPHKTLTLFGENEPQERALVRRDGLDAIWVDDFHHTTAVAAKHRAEAYMLDFRGDARDLVGCIEHNALFQGQWYDWQSQPRGSLVMHDAPETVVFALQNHDQVANSLRGERLHVEAGASLARALTFALLLAPQTPLLFMGDEFFASTPYRYFADHGDELMRAVQKGRTAFLGQFPSTREALRHTLVDCGVAAFKASQLDWRDVDSALGRGALTLHRTLLRLRRDDAVFSAQRKPRGATLNDHVALFRFGDDKDARLVIVNLGDDATFDKLSEPLLAPCERSAWHGVLSSEDSQFHGRGVLFPVFRRPLMIPGHTAVVLSSRAAS